MIEYCDISIARDGGVAVMIPPAGLDPDDAPQLRLSGGLLEVAQNGRVVVRVAAVPETAAAAIRATDDITVFELSRGGDGPRLVPHAARKVNA